MSHQKQLDKKHKDNIIDEYSDADDTKKGTRCNNFNYNCYGILEAESSDSIHKI